MTLQHLFGIESLERDTLEQLLDLTDHFAEVSRRNIPRVPALRGKTVASLFFEDSTRTRLSFETAAKRLSADTMTFSVSSSSMNKGESIRDTVETVHALGADAMVVRHKSAGVPQRIAQWVPVNVINAGDGWHEHPTQALLDCYTLRAHRGALDGMRIAIVGDIKHSRVARSDIHAFTKLGASVVIVAPNTLVPPSVESWPVTVTHDLDRVLGEVDAVYLLRMQRERMQENLIPSLREYHHDFGLTPERLTRLKPDTLILHPGPMNRGVEISVEAASHPNAVITEQVANGVAVRMAVLYLLLGSGVDLLNAEGEP